MKYKIIVDKQPRNNPSDEKKEYEIDIEELRVKGDVYDSLIITREEDYVMRRLSLSENMVLTVLDEPIKEPIPELNIELFEGDNYVYLIDMVGNRFYAEYLIKNDFTDLYVTESRMQSVITQTSSSILGAVSLSLDNLDKTISASLELKLNKEDLISEINASADIINFTAGKFIIDTPNLKFDGKGNVTVSGEITSNSGKIGGWTINSDGLTNEKVFIRNDGSSTIYTVADLIIMRGYIMGYTGFNLSSEMIQHYDLNGDGEVGPGDFVMLQNLIGISMT